MNLKLNQKLSFVFALLFIISGLTFYFLVNFQMSKLIIDIKLSSESNMGYSFLNMKHPGEWSVKGGQLYKGETLINNNYEVVDEIKKNVGSLAAIFMGDTRISTNVTTESGGRAVGTKAADQVVDTVLKNGKEYVGEANVAGKMALTKYIPLKDASGEIVGMWFIGIEKSYVEGQLRGLQIMLAIVIFILVVAGIIVSSIFSNSISNPILNAIKDLNDGAEQVASASAQFSSSSQQLADGNSEMAASIEETSATLEESSSMIRQNTENTKQAAQLSNQAKASAEKGNADMQEMMRAMDEIQKSSDQIAKIIKVIDEIAFQTNILALNAAVEAARAGEAGMGFAVVAEEVRNLAQRSAQAAKDTAGIIEGSIEMSANGVRVVHQVADSLAEIVEQSKKVNELMDEISAASEEQTQGIIQITKAISQMEQVTQQNAATAEESAASSEQLSAQAETLRDVVGKLYRIVNGANLKDSSFDNEKLSVSTYIAGSDDRKFLSE